MKRAKTVTMSLSEYNELQESVAAVQGMIDSKKVVIMQNNGFTVFGSVIGAYHIITRSEAVKKVVDTYEARVRLIKRDVDRQRDEVKRLEAELEKAKTYSLIKEEEVEDLQRELLQERAKKNNCFYQQLKKWFNSKVEV